MTKKQVGLLYLLIAIFTPISLCAEPIFSYKDRFHPEIGQNGMVATQEKHATTVGLSILKEGGTAFDAAVAVGYTLAVTLPRAGNIGGGGFMVAYVASENKVVALDFREKAPIAAYKKMFLGEDNNVNTSKSRFSIHAAGVPGSVAGLNEINRKYGSKKLKDLMQPAITLASQGFRVSYDLHHSLNNMKQYLLRSDAKAIFFDSRNTPLAVGDTLIQKDLAKTLDQIASKGRRAFYTGSIAKKIVKFMENSGGIITAEDLEKYSPVWRDPIHGTYRGYDIYTMPSPSSGGIHVVQLLNMMELFDVEALGHNSADHIHLLSEATKRAYADRGHYLGDTDFVKVPVKELTSKEYAQKAVLSFNLTSGTPANDISFGTFHDTESNETTQFTIADKYGNVVSITYTLNFSYGSGIMVSGTGMLLNNQMDDFTAKPGAPNAYGLIGSVANMIEPQKRMLSSMTPTIVLKEGKPFFATGSPGGSRIITTVLQQIMNVIDFKMNPQEAASVVRVHNQLYPDEIRIEEGLSPDTIHLLEEKGHNVVVKSAMGSVQSIMFKDGNLHGATDPRKPGSSVQGF